MTRTTLRTLALLVGLAAWPAQPGPILLNCACTEAGPDVPDPPDDTNSAPVWNIPDRTLTVGDPCTYDLSTVNSDADGDTRTYSLVSGTLPTGCSLVNGTLTGTTSAAGTFNFVLGVDDGQNTVLRDTFTSSGPLAWSSAATFSPAQTDTFQFSYSITPAASNIDHVCGFGTDAPTGYGQLLYAIRIRSTGIIDARNNADYAAVNSFPYSGGTTYNVTGEINLEAKTYDVSVNGTVIANDYAPRGNTTVADLDYWTCVDAASPGTTGTVSGPLYLIQPVKASVTWAVAPDDDVTPPDAPDAPTVTGVTQTTVTMTLPAPESHFDLYRSPAGCGSFVSIATGLTSANSPYTDTGLTQNTAYCYRLVEFDAAGNDSDPGSTANATTAAVDVNALLSIANVAVNEGNASTTNMTFVLTSSASQAFHIVCQYTTQGGSADSSTDFTAAAGTVQIDSSTTTENIVVVINGDTTVESDETVGMRVFNCGQGGIAVNATEFTATGTITNDDEDVGGEEGLVCTEPTEGTSGLVAMTCTYTLADPAEEDTSFEYYTVDGTATAWVDYTPVSGVGIIREGDDDFEFVIHWRGDTTAESDETITVRINNIGAVP